MNSTSKVWCSYELGFFLLEKGRAKMIQFVPVQIGHICACLFIFVMLIQLTVHAVLLIGFDGPSPVDLLLVTGIVATALVLQAIVIIPVLQYTLTAMLKDLSQLPRQVTEFRVQDSECTCCALQHRHPVSMHPSLATESSSTNLSAVRSDHPPGRWMRMQLSMHLTPTCVRRSLVPSTEISGNIA